jgi:hypothetical protein
VDPNAPSIGKDVYRSEEYATSKSSSHKVVCYWKNGEVEKDLPQKAPNALRFVAISDTHNKTDQFKNETLKSLNIPKDR